MRTHLRFSEAEGIHLQGITSVGKKRKRRLDAYECLGSSCHFDFRVTADPKLVESHGFMVYCPVCGSLYCEWLS